MKHDRPRRRLWTVKAAFALAWLSACGDPAAANERTEILRELQALRATIADGQRGARPHEVDRQLLDAALQPLRELLQGLVADQASLRERQGTLASELGRWSALVAAGTSAEAKDELGALRARLDKMEQELRQQDTRHRDMQELMRKALDLTADRLEGFLNRLEGTTAPVGPDRAKGTGPVPDKGGVDAAPAGAADAGKASRSGTEPFVRQGYERKGPGGETLTIILLVIGILAAGLLAWRLWREGAAHRQHASSVQVRNEGLAPPPEPSTGWDAVELLAASLADHVERVETATRVVEQRRAPQPVVEATPAGPEAETIVLADEDDAVWQMLGVPGHGGSAPKAHVSVQPAVAAAAETTTRSRVGEGPVWLATDLVQDGEVAARAFLQREVRGLRRPAPVFTDRGDRLHVELAVLPGLPAAERVQILQRLLLAVPPAAGKNGSRNSASL
jgi:hypothetical protein